MNVNFPDRTPDAIEGLAITTQGKRESDLLSIDARHDTWGTPYYWLAYERRRSKTVEGTDLWAVYNGHISVTPLSMNLTHRPTQAALEPVFAAKRP